MSKIIPIAFFCVMGAVGVGMDYHLYTQRVERFAGVGVAPGASYISDVQQRIALARKEKSDGMLAQNLPGWDVHKFAAADMVILTGAGATTEQAEAFQDVSSREAFGMAVTPGVKKTDYALYKADQGVALSIIQLASNGGIATQALMAQNSFVKMLGDLDGGGPVDFATVDGVTVVELPKAAKADPALRSFRATLTDAITVNLATRSADNALILEALGAVDFVGLNAELKEPLPGVVEKMAALSRDAGAASQQEAALPDAKAAQGSAAEQVAQQQAVPDTPAAGGMPCVRRAGVLTCPDS